MVFESATYNFKIICILTIKLTIKNNIFIKKGRSKIYATDNSFCVTDTYPDKPIGEIIIRLSL
jgi:hypothetical protein